MFTYKCSNFNYSVITSASQDYGMLAVVKTHICQKSLKKSSMGCRPVSFWIFVVSVTEFKVR
jgi:hypothetical protein